MPCAAGRCPGIADRDGRHTLGEVDRRVAGDRPSLRRDGAGSRRRRALLPAGVARAGVALLLRPPGRVAVLPHRRAPGPTRWPGPARAPDGGLGTRTPACPRLHRRHMGRAGQLDAGVSVRHTTARRASRDHGRDGGRHRERAVGPARSALGQGFVPQSCRAARTIRSAARHVGPADDASGTPRGRLGRVLVRQKQAIDTHGRAGSDTCCRGRPERGSRSDRERPGRATWRGRGLAPRAATAGSSHRASAQFAVRGPQCATGVLEPDGLRHVARPAARPLAAPGGSHGGLCDRAAPCRHDVRLPQRHRPISRALPPG